MDKLSEGTSIESLLREKLKTLFAAMDERNDNMFDETTDTIEMLLSYDTNAFDNLKAYQSKLKDTLEMNMSSIYEQALNCQTTISKKNYIMVNQHNHEWQFRKNYLFKIISLFISRGILESELPVNVKIEKVQK